MYIKDFDSWNEMQKHLNLATYLLNFRAKLFLCVFTNLRQFLKKEYFLVRVGFQKKSLVR